MPAEQLRGPIGQTFPASPPLTSSAYDSSSSNDATPNEWPERELYGDLFPNIPAWTPQDNTLLTSQALHYIGPILPVLADEIFNHDWSSGRFRHAVLVKVLVCYEV